MYMKEGRLSLRHEQKHLINYSSMLALRARLSAVMHQDPHAVNGSYYIRSLYFDDLYDRALREKTDGTDPREKFRIRYYNLDPSLLLLEKKRKIRDLTEKTQEVLTEEEARLLSLGDPVPLLQTEKPLLRELVSKMQYRGLRPKTIVDYIREPFILEPGHVRVTLDHHIRTGMYATDLLDPDCAMLPAGDQTAVLEVKWDAFLPSIVRDLVRIEGTRTTAFSKYEAARIYG